VFGAPAVERDLYFEPKRMSEIKEIAQSASFMFFLSDKKNINGFIEHQETGYFSKYRY
jgi:hypothetical protein